MDRAGHPGQEAPFSHPTLLAPGAVRQQLHQPAHTHDSPMSLPPGSLHPLPRMPLQKSGISSSPKTGTPAPSQSHLLPPPAPGLGTPPPGSGPGCTHSPASALPLRPWAPSDLPLFPLPSSRRGACGEPRLEPPAREAPPPPTPRTPPPSSRPPPHGAPSCHPSQTPVPGPRRPSRVILPLTSLSGRPEDAPPHLSPRAHSAGNRRRRTPRLRRLRRPRAAGSFPDAAARAVSQLDVPASSPFCAGERRVVPSPPRRGGPRLVSRDRAEPAGPEACSATWVRARGYLDPCLLCQEAGCSPALGAVGGAGPVRTGEWVIS